MDLYDNDFCCMELYDKHFLCMEVNHGCFQNNENCKITQTNVLKNLFQVNHDKQVKKFFLMKLAIGLTFWPEKLKRYNLQSFFKKQLSKHFLDIKVVRLRLQLVI